MKRTGFTLLELVISCAMLVGLFSILALMMTRAHRLRSYDEEQARIMTQGRAFLDRLADEIRNTCGTNLTPAGKMRDDRYEFSFVRVKAHPRGTLAGEAATNLPFERITYSVDGALTGGFTKATSTWIPSTAGFGTTNYATEYRFTRKDGKGFTITNVHSATDKVSIHSASKGDTISIPVTSGSSKRIYDTVNRSSVHVDIVPTESTLTNRVLATIAFTNAFSSVVTNSIRRPLAGKWPEAQAGQVRLKRKLDLFAETWTNECTLLPLGLPYTNAVPFLASTNFLAYTETSIPSATNLPVGVATNTPLNDQSSETNIVATTIWSLTNLHFSASEGADGNPPKGLAIFFADEPAFKTNLWRIGNPPAQTNETQKGTATGNLVRPGQASSPVTPTGEARTNGWDGTGVHVDSDGALDTFLPGHSTAAPPPSLPTNRTNGIIVGLHSGDFFTIPHPVQPPAVSADSLRELIPPMAFDNHWVARTAENGPTLPLAFYRTETLNAPSDPGGILCELSGNAMSIGLDGENNRSIVRSLRIGRLQEIDLREEYAENGAETNFTAICASRFQSTATFRLQMDIPSFMAQTNRYEAFLDDSNRVRKGISQSKDTSWETVTLDDDLPETAADIVGLWLEETKREGSEWAVEKTELSKPVPREPEESREHERFDATAPCVTRLRFIPLSFHKGKDTLVLIEWDPSDDKAEPPVCVDIYLELIAPVHKKRAMAITDETKRNEYVNRHLIRLTRRVPLNQRNLWRPAK